MGTSLPPRCAVLFSDFFHAVEYACFIQVIGNVRPDMNIVREEVFGPVVVVYTFKDEVCPVK